MKKIVSVLLTMLFIASLVQPQAIASSTNNGWSGKVKAPTKLRSVKGVYYYEISNAEELAYISQNSGSWGDYNYILTNDIVINSTKLTYDSNGNLITDEKDLKQWTTMGSFSGIFNGNGHKISGMYINSSTQSSFIYYCRGKILNLTIDNAYLKGSEVGGFATYLYGEYSNYSEVENCYFKGAIVSIGSAGGVAASGNMYSTISKCGNYGDIFCIDSGGEMCMFEGVGGIIGYADNNDIRNSFNAGNIYSNISMVGGIAGYADGMNAEKCSNKGNITAPCAVGGIAGYLSSSYRGIENCTNTGTISGNSCVGGICGQVYESNIETSYNTGKVTGTDVVGGIVGDAEKSDIYNCYSYGNVTGTSSVGAVAGESDVIWGKGSINDCCYLKNNLANTSLNGLGNVSDFPGVSTVNHTEFLCIDANNNINTEGHLYKTNIIKKATTSKNGSEVSKCKFCGDIAWQFDVYYAKTFKLSATSYTYNGRTRKPTVMVCDSMGYPISSLNYTISYKNNKNVGKATVTIKFKGDYSGTKTLSFVINPPKTSIKKLTAAKKSLKVSINKKTTQVTGYEIQYSTSKKFTKSTTKTTKVKKAKTTSTTLKKLKAKKTYYVRIRTFKTVKGKKYYSGWSKVLKKKTK